MKGHMEKDGFHPHTEHKGIRKSRDQQAKTQGVRLKRTDGSRIKKVQFKVWKYNDAPDELQEKIIEKLRQRKYEFADDWFAQDDGILYDERGKKDAKDMGLKYAHPKYYDVDSNRGTDFIQFELEIEDDKKFEKYLGMSNKLLEKVNYHFENDSGNWGSNNTRLQFTDIEGSDISLEHDTASGDEHYSGHGFEPDQIPTLPQVTEMLHAHDKFADLMDDSLKHLRTNYEYQFSDEALIEDAKANEYEFDEDGNIT